MERLQRLISHFTRLPGIGKKSASRIAYWLLESDRSFIQRFSNDLGLIRDQVVRCQECGNYAEAKICDICDSTQRDRSMLCIVEQSKDVSTIEATGEFHGLYHVLHGVLSPLDGFDSEKLGLPYLFSRIRAKGIKEVIVATNPTLEGDSTALYIVRMLAEDNVTVSRIASGLPVGGDMEYADKLSIARALRSRQDLAQ